MPGYRKMKSLDHDDIKEAVTKFTLSPWQAVMVLKFKEALSW